MALVADSASTSAPRPGLWTLIAGDIACVQSRDPAARNQLEVVITYPGVHAIIWHRVAHRLWDAKFKFPARFVSWFARLVTGIDIHPGATIGQRFFIDHGTGVVIGETATVGNDVTLYHGVTLGGVSWSPGRRHPNIEDGVLVGAGAKILGPITVGARSRIGANSVVIEGVPPDSTVVGIPGKIVRSVADRRRIAGGRVDLEHHLMPDPVGDAVSYVMDRIDFLEVRLAEAKEEIRALRAKAGAAGPSDPAAAPAFANTNAKVTGEDHGAAHRHP